MKGDAMRSTISSLLEVAGAATVAAGTFIVSVPLGLIVTGGLLMVFGYQAGDDE